MCVSDYQKEQAESLAIVRKHLSSISRAQKEDLRALARDYLAFREQVGRFLVEHFGGVCRRKCYESDLSACCSREGIITFFADMVLNALVSTPERLDALEAVLGRNASGRKCVYLGPEGCLWDLKPIVCEMFLCDSAKKDVFEKKTEAGTQWEEFRKQEKLYKWPDRPVLFDRLEKIFMEAGYRSSLMYFHFSPGLVRVKKLAGLD